MKRETLCWGCKNATSKDKCCWAGGKPRKDWVAIPTMVNASETRKHIIRFVPSYCVLSCKGFVPDK